MKPAQDIFVINIEAGKPTFARHNLPLNRGEPRMITLDDDEADFDWHHITDLDGQRVVVHNTIPAYDPVICEQLLERHEAASLETVETESAIQVPLESPPGKEVLGSYETLADQILGGVLYAIHHPENPQAWQRVRDTFRLIPARITAHTAVRVYRLLEIDFDEADAHAFAAKLEEWQ